MDQKQIIDALQSIAKRLRNSRVAIAQRRREQRALLEAIKAVQAQPVHVYRKIVDDERHPEAAIYTVGYYTYENDGLVWHPILNFDTETAAINHVHFLNGERQ